MIQLIQKEKVDIVIDLHEAELQYPVISTIVAHQKGEDLAALVSMMVSGMEGFNIGMEYSPEALHGLSHREIGDHTQAISLLLEEWGQRSGRFFGTAIPTESLWGIWPPPCRRSWGEIPTWISSMNIGKERRSHVSIPENSDHYECYD